MKKIMKLLAAVLLITCFFQKSVTASAESDEILAQGKCGDNVNYVLYESGKLVISGNGDMRDYSHYSSADFKQYSDEVNKVVIKNGITSIGDFAFEYCSKINSVEIPNSVTSIGAHAFASCDNLTSIEIPNSVTSIDSYAFFDCYRLTSVSLSDKLTKISSRLFNGCGSLVSIEIPEGVTSIGEYAFDICSGLVSVKIPNSVTSIESSAFSGCASLVSIDIPDSVVSLGDYAFSDCKSLVSVDLSNKLNKIDNSTFSSCESLVSIDIPETVTSIGERAFTNCRSLSSIIISDNVTSIGESAFYGCKNLVSVEMPDKLKEIEAYTFYTCNSLTSIEIPKNVTSIGESAFYNCTSLGSVQFFGNCPTIKSNAFERTTANAYYPKGNATFTKDVKKNYGGFLAWIEYDLAQGPVPAPTPTPTSTPVPTPTPVPSDDVIRIKGKDRFMTSFEIADAFKEELGVEKFDAVIFVDGRNFADALAGSYLAAQKSAPIIMIDKNNASKMESVNDYLNNHLDSEGTVYILGGEAAVPAFAEQTGFNTIRLKGKDRYGTNLEILKEAGGEMNEILIANAKNFADSLSASATGLPMLLVGGSLNEDQKSFLNEHRGAQLTILGGTGAVSENVEQALNEYGNVRRIYGKTRYETSLEIAREYFPDADSAVFAYAKNFPDGLAGGPLAYTSGSPLILTATGNTKAQEYTVEKGITKGAVLGGSTLIDNETVKDMTGHYPVNTGTPETFTVTFKMRDADKGTLSAAKVTVQEGQTLEGKIPNVTFVTVDSVNGWKLDGYYVNNQKYTKETLSNYIVYSNTSIEVRTMPDMVGQDGDYVTISDGIDDRLQATVTFKDYNGKVLKQQVIMKGDDAEAPTNLIRNGYTHTGWDVDYKNVQVAELTVTATYTKNDYWTIKFIFDSSRGVSGVGSMSFTTIHIKDGKKLTEIPTISFTEEEQEAGWKVLLGEDGQGWYYGWERENYIPSLNVTTWESITPSEILNMSQTQDITFRLVLFKDRMSKGKYTDEFNPDGIDDRVQSIITYVDWDDTVLKKEVVNSDNSGGCNKFIPPATPEREGYIFTGWDEGIYEGEMSGCYSTDTTIRATYKQKSQHVIVYQFESGDSGTINKSSYFITDGEKIGNNIPDLSFTGSNLHWKFVSYYVKNGSEKVYLTRSELSNYVVNESFTVYIHTMPDKYGQGEGNNTETPDGIDDREQVVIRFLDYNWSVIKGVVLPVGVDTTAPEVPPIEGYNFIGWDSEYTNLPAGVHSIQALYDETPQPYLIYYAVRQGDVAQLSIKEVYVNPGEKIGAGNVANVTFTEGDLENGWTFDGYYIDGIKYSGLQIAILVPTDNMWIEVRTFPDIVGQGENNATNVPDGIDDRNQVIVKFLDYDGTLLKAEVVMKGGDATPPKAPTHEGMTFTKWGTNYTNVQTNTRVLAKYETQVQYDIFYYLRDGDCCGVITFETATVNGGENIGESNIPEPVISSSFANQGWKLEGYYVNGQKYTKSELAQFKPSEYLEIEIRTMPDAIGQGEGNNVTTPDGIDDRLQAVVRFYDDATLLKAQVVMLGANATAPTTPEKDGYKFLGWDKDFTNVQNDLNIYSVYE